MHQVPLADVDILVVAAAAVDAVVLALAAVVHFPILMTNCAQTRNWYLVVISGSVPWEAMMARSRGEMMGSGMRRMRRRRMRTTMRMLLLKSAVNCTVLTSLSLPT